MTVELIKHSNLDDLLSSTHYQITDNNLNVNNLPYFSPWPERLLGLEPWKQRYRTPKEIMREYENEKWGPLLKQVTDIGEGVTVETVEKWSYENSPPTLCSINDELKLLFPIDVRVQYLNLIEEILTAYLPATSLVELGAGYSSLILALAKREQFAKMSIAAGEYTNSGIELLKYLANAQNLEVKIGHCDFGSPSIFDFSIPEDAIILTSYAACYIPKLTPDFTKSLSSCHPKAVIHFEPCYEHCDSTLLGLMRRRYIEVNDYNTNLVGLLHDQQARGLIRILDEQPNTFGMNPLLPASVLVWEPLI